MTKRMDFIELQKKLLEQPDGYNITHDDKRIEKNKARVDYSEGERLYHRAMNLKQKGDINGAYTLLFDSYRLNGQDQETLKELTIITHERTLVLVKNKKRYEAERELNLCRDFNFKMQSPQFSEIELKYLEASIYCSPRGKGISGEVRLKAIDVFRGIPDTKKEPWMFEQLAFMEFDIEDFANAEATVMKAVKQSSNASGLKEKFRSYLLNKAAHYSGNNRLHLIGLAIMINPKNPKDDGEYIIKAELKEGELANAEDHVRQLIELFPDDWRFKVKLNGYLQEQKLKNSRKAPVQKNDELEKNKPISKEELRNHIENDLELHNYTDAINDLVALNSREPGNIETLTILGYSLLEADRNEEAGSIFSKILDEIDGMDFFAMYGKGLVLEKQGIAAAAEETFDLVYHFYSGLPIDDVRDMRRIDNFGIMKFIRIPSSSIYQSVAKSYTRKIKRMEPPKSNDSAMQFETLQTGEDWRYNKDLYGR